MPSPAQTRDSRIEHLVSITEVYLEDGGSENNLFDKIESATFRLWPNLRSRTRREYATTAYKVVLSRPHTTPIMPETVGEDVPSQEVKQ